MKSRFALWSQLALMFVVVLVIALNFREQGIICDLPILPKEETLVASEESTAFVNEGPVNVEEARTCLAEERRRLLARDSQEDPIIDFGQDLEENHRPQRLIDPSVPMPTLPLEKLAAELPQDVCGNDFLHSSPMNALGLQFSRDPVEFYDLYWIEDLRSWMNSQMLEKLLKVLPKLIW